MHSHTKEFGFCAHVWASDAIDAHVAEGYDGICITNHFFRYGMETMAGDSWEQKVDSWLDGYLAACKQAERYPGFDVILGAEVRLDEGYEEYLLYGFTREMIVENPQLLGYTQKELYDFANRNDLLMIQAHPFRKSSQLKDLQYLHGIEVFNGNPRHEDQNEKAQAVAQENPGLIALCGSDYHQSGDEGSAAMYFDAKIHDGKMLIAALKSDRKKTPEAT